MRPGVGQDGKEGFLFRAADHAQDNKRGTEQDDFRLGAAPGHAWKLWIINFIKKG
jgi:hypothetical protein